MPMPLWPVQLQSNRISGSSLSVCPLLWHLPCDRQPEPDPARRILLLVPHYPGSGHAAPGHDASVWTTPWRKPGRTLSGSSGNVRRSCGSRGLSNVLLLGQGHCFRDHVLDACPACIPKPGLIGDLPHTVEGSSLETIRHMVVSGLGVTVLPCTAAGAHTYSQRLLSIRRFSNPVPTRTVALAWRASFPRTKIIDVINTAVRNCNLSCVKHTKNN